MGKTRPRGRPPSGRPPLKKRVIRVTDDRWKAYRKMADAAGMNLNAWIRKVLDKATK